MALWQHEHGFLVVLDSAKYTRQRAICAVQSEDKRHTQVRAQHLAIDGYPKRWIAKVGALATRDAQPLV